MTDHYNKVRNTLQQLQKLRDDIETVMAQCINELQKEPVDVNKTIEDIRQERIEIDELARRGHKILFKAEVKQDPQQALFDMKERLSKIIQEPPKQSD